MQLTKLLCGLLITLIGFNTRAESLLINGAGASFPYPLYAKWFSEYKGVDKTVEINYQSIGSGGGVRQFLAGTTDFGASDAPMTEKEITDAKQPVLHIPTTLGAVVVTYNVPGVTGAIKLSSEVVADIFMGKITKWDDEAIAKLNPKVKFPKGQNIIVCYRSDGSGTTDVFTDYLSKVSPTFKEKLGRGKSVNWPTGLGGKGNEGVTGLVKQNPGAIGYIEMVYAKSNSLPMASVKNKAGEFVAPSVASVTASAAGALKAMPDDFRVSITDAEGKNAYPISAFTYILIHQQQKAPKGAKMVEFLNWAMGPGQKMAASLEYAPLPDSLIKKVKGSISSIKVQ